MISNDLYRWVCLSAPLFAACVLDAGEGQDSSGDSTDTDPSADSTGGCEPTMLGVDPPNESACGPLATDFVPGADDDYPACVADNGEWTVVFEDPPGAQARVEAYESMMDLLRGGTTPDAAAFTMARTLYAQDEGLESRLLRREDLHYPPVPAADQDAGVDFDKQCTVADNATTYTDRCVGPAKIAPMINDAFAAGMTGEGDANVHAARIDAGVLWFLWVSTYKEAASCVELPEDCDAHHAYYDGNALRASPLGVGAEINAISPLAHGAIFDGMLAIRCWRDLYPDALLWEDFGADGQDTFEAAHEQLDNALWYGWARLVRDRLEKHPLTCGSEAAASWAFIEVVGPVLDVEAESRDAAAAATLAALWANDAPAAADLEGAIAAIDAAFPCPQCTDCEVPQGYGY
jgi:hypothetical protein